MECIKAASAPLPRHKPGVEKSWWTPHLSELHQQSMDIHHLWIAEGKPGHGSTHREKIRVRAAYKRALKSAQRAPKQASWNRLHGAMASNDTDTFWKSWRQLYAKTKSPVAPVVDGLSSKDAIAETFRENFESIARPNKPQRVAELNQKFTDAYDKLCSVHEENCDCTNYSMSINNTIDAILNLKSGKSADDDSISAEHFLNAPYNVIVKLTDIFNRMLRHSFVPDQFKNGTIIPIVKDHQGNLSDVNNYRGITISPIASKIFEHALKIVFGDFLSSSPWQFGFKRRSSTMHAVYCLKESVDYYINNGSRVFCAFLDASKAFDRLVHAGLFLKFIAKGLPKIFIDIIIFWYRDLFCRVKWDGSFSQWFQVLAGVRQGGVLSPSFYCLYIDDLVKELESLNIGCYILEMFMAALLYADDMALLAPSVKGLNLLLQCCSRYCDVWDICLNSSKSKLVYFGKTCKDLFRPCLNGQTLEWVSSWTYLGVSVVSGRRFCSTVTDRIKKFYRCANAIFRIEGRSDDLTMLQLVQSHCVPLLTYGMEVAYLRRNERSKIRAAYNSLFRKIFGYRWFESVTDLQLSLGCPTWELLIEQMKVSFYERLALSKADSPVHILSLI